jgi:hypothetical protein
MTAIWETAAVPFTYVLLLIVSGIFWLFGFHATSAPSPVTEKGIFLQFCRQVEERRFVFWSRFWVCCTSLALLFYSFMPRIGYLVLCGGSLVSSWLISLLLWRTNVVERDTSGKMFSFASLLYVFASKN